MKNNKGFTLIELLVVISIIGLLASIVLGFMQQARAQAKIAAVREGVHQYATAIELYHLDHDAYPPTTIMGAEYCLGNPLCGDGHPKSPDPLLTSELQQYIPAMPAVDTGIIFFDNSYWRNNGDPDIQDTYFGGVVYLNCLNSLCYNRGDPTQSKAQAVISWFTSVPIGISSDQAASIACGQVEAGPVWFGWINSSLGQGECFMDLD